MKRMFGGTLLLLVVFSAVMAAAQSASTGAQLSGAILDPKGAVVSGASVTLRSDATGLEQATASDSSGQYRFVLVPAGQYTLLVNASGFAKLTYTGITLTVGQAANLPINLQVATAREELTVTGDAELVETQRTSIATTVDQRRIDNLPINGRNYVQFTLTNSQTQRDAAPSIGAAPTSGLNIGGQRARGNLVNVDGEDAVDNSTNGIRSTVSQEAVQEFQLITSGYAAEYGRASGGVVNIITRSGTNAFHGTAFGYLRNRNLQAANAFSTVQDPAYTRVQSGVTLGGPIKKDKTFYFFSFETNRRHETGFSSVGANNFGFVPLTLPASPAVGFPGGTIQVTPAQAQFIGANAAVLGNPANPLFPLLFNYIFLAGASSSVATTRVQPASFGGRAGFATTCTPTTPVCAPLPASYVGLNTARGNFPVFEGTSIYSLRLDHRVNNAHQFLLRASVSPSTVTGIQVNAQGPAENFGQNAYSRTSQQSFRDAGFTAQHIWSISPTKVNEFRFQFVRRGLLYNFSSDPNGGNVGVNIPGFAFIGREPFSYVRRTEKRFQVTDNFSLNSGPHNVKLGFDYNHLPLSADFTVNFGGVYNFGEISPTSLGLPATVGTQTIPNFSGVQAYGLGIPQTMVQGVGNPHDAFKNKTLGLFIQDSWHIVSNLTMNYGIRYDIEFTPTFKASTPLAQAAFDAMGVTQGIPVDANNFAPRVGFAWDPFKNGKTAVRASYGIFYDHPLLALAFDSDVADMTQAPQILLFGGAPAACAGNGISQINATNTFQGLLTCLPANFGYLPNQQRFDASLQNSVWVNQNYLTAGVPLGVLPFGFPTAKNFEYAYSNQGSFGIEQNLGHDLALGVTYNFNGGRHLNRPINANYTRGDLLVSNWRAAVAAGAVPASTLPIQVSQDTRPAAGGAPCGTGPAGNWVSAPAMNFFRPSGFNPTLVPLMPAACLAMMNQIATQNNLGVGVPVPFSSIDANYSNGSSVYHGLTANLRKRFNGHYEFLASYTWSHSIDDSTDLQSPLEPQDSQHPNLERSNSLFDQRHRFVFSGVYQSGKVAGGNGVAGHLFSDWTIAPIIEAASGRPFAILTGGDRNFDFGPNTDRPLIVPSGTAVNSCGDAAVASKYSPTGFLQPPCWINGTLTGNLGRNAGLKPGTLFTDIRIARRLHFGDRINLDGMLDVFNFINRFNVADVNILYTQAGTPTSAYDPRQLQVAVKLTW